MSDTARQRDPPETATDELDDDELTPLEACSPEVDDVDDDALVDVVLFDVVLFDVVLFDVDVVEAPGMVTAAMPPSTPTAATAPTATHVVIWFKRRIAASRASIRDLVLWFMFGESGPSLSAQAWSALRAC